jgi:hypothetical protein
MVHVTWCSFMTVERKSRTLFSHVLHCIFAGQSSSRSSGKSFLTESEYRPLSHTDKMAYIIVAGLRALTAIFAFLAAVATAYNISNPNMTMAEWSVFIPSIALGIYCAATALICHLLIRTFVDTVRLDDAETLANVQGGLWKFASYWLIIFLAVTFVLFFERALPCDSPGRCVPAAHTFARAAFLPAVLAVSIGFIPVLVDTRKELRAGRVKVARRIAEAAQPLPNDTSKVSAPRRASIAAGLVVAAIMLLRSRGKR